MKNTTETAKAFLKSKDAAWWGDNSNFPELLVGYHEHVMKEMEKQCTDEKIWEATKQGSAHRLNWSGMFVEGAKHIRSIIFPNPPVTQ